MIQTLAYLPGLVLALTLIAGMMVSGIKNKSNKIFVFLVGSVFIWQTLLFLSDTTNSKFYAELFLRTALVFSMFMPYYFVVFCLSFLDKGSRLVNALLYIPIFFAQILSLTLYTFTDIELRRFGVYVVDPLWGYTSVVLITTSYILAGILLLLLNKSRQTYQKKSQINLIAAGVSASLVVSFIANFVLINSRFAEYVILATGPAIIFFIGSIGVAVIKHGLFDIRLVVARTLGYLLSVGVLAFVYGLLAFSVAEIIFANVNSSRTLQQFVYTLLAVVLAFTFQPLKRFFDRWSNKIFYRDAYETQELLDNLNKVLVSTIELEKLLSNSAKIINETLKTEFCIFGIKEIGKSPQRIIGTAHKEFSPEDITEVRAITPKMRIKTIVADELDESQANLQTLMRKNDIAVLVRLTDTPNQKAEGIGYIVLGNKKSGSPFARQDLAVLEIIADELVIAIQNSLRFEEIKNFNVTLQDKVDDATRKLRAANQRLIELDQTKDDFISMASHQLRTPLTSIKGYVSMVMEGDAGKITKKQSELLDQAFTSSQRMVYLIADLLNVSRLRTGKFVIEPKETNLANVIDGEIAQLKETAKGRNLELTYDKPKNFPTLMLDETKIRQVIMNFADNAIYYTPSGGHIAVVLEDKGETIEFAVTDDGIGVPKSEQHHMFNKFYRAHNAKKARPDGTGLGLFMAKKVVVAQGGSIIFKSQEGKGSTFGFSFEKKKLLPENFKGIARNSKK